MDIKQQRALVDGAIKSVAAAMNSRLPAEEREQRLAGGTANLRQLIADGLGDVPGTDGITARALLRTLASQTKSRLNLGRILQPGGFFSK